MIVIVAFNRSYTGITAYLSDADIVTPRNNMQYVFATRFLE